MATIGQDGEPPAGGGGGGGGSAEGRAVRGARPRSLATVAIFSSIGWTSLPRLPKLRPPTLILAGDDDPIIPLVNARIMHRLIPRSELHIYHGGHLELVADAESIAPVVEAFLDAAPATPESQATKGNQR